MEIWNTVTGRIAKFQMEGRSGRAGMLETRKCRKWAENVGNEWKCRTGVGNGLGKIQFMTVSPL